jgi:hypothetical protein
MERCRIYIDKMKLEELIRLGQTEWFASVEAVYEEVEKILGRNVRPGWYRIMRGLETVPGAADCLFDPNRLKPNYMEVREEALQTADRTQIDPVSSNSAGKRIVKSIKKEVPKLIEPKKTEMVDFPEIYDVTIADQTGLLLRELGVTGLRVTEKSGQIKTSKDELDRVIEEAGDQFPFMPKIKRFRETAKALGSNLFPLWWDLAPERSPDGTVRVGYTAHDADTGRFTTKSPADKKAFHGQVRWNLHSIPATYQKDRPECMLRMRELVHVRPSEREHIKKLLFAIDYSGVELRIVTNISREPKWLDEFFRCSACGLTFDRGNGRETPEAPPPFCPKCGSDKIGDLHTLTALSVYGEGITADPKLFKEKRQKSKSLNFAMCYGGGGSAAQRAVNVDKDEGWRIKRQFDASYKGLQKWWEQQKAFAKKYEYVVTAFHRRYPLPDIKHESGFFRSKAERNAVNGPIQGTSADVTKLAMGIIHRELKKRGWLGKVLMLITIHDELVFEIDTDIAEEAVELLIHIMTRNSAVLKLKHPVPLKCDIEFGYDWSVPYNLTEMTWNHSKKKWTSELAAVFPKAYANYLKCGGTPVDGTPSPPATGVTPPKVSPGPVSEAAPPSPEAASPSSNSESKAVTPPPEVESGKPYTYTIHSSRLSYGLMDKLARIIVECEGRGTQPLLLRTEGGDPLWEGSDPLVSVMEFEFLAQREGV